MINIMYMFLIEKYILKACALDASSITTTPINSVLIVFRFICTGSDDCFRFFKTLFLS